MADHDAQADNSEDRQFARDLHSEPREIAVEKRAMRAEIERLREIVKHVEPTLEIMDQMESQLDQEFGLSTDPPRPRDARDDLDDALKRYRGSP